MQRAPEVGRDNPSVQVVWVSSDATARATASLGLALERRAAGCRSGGADWLSGSVAGYFTRSSHTWTEYASR
jgi:hypothetical protein